MVQLDNRRELANAVVVVIEHPDTHRLLMIERAGPTSYPGYWNPVTGQCESSDADSLFATCLREAKEEVGLDVEVIGKLWSSTTARAHFVLHWFLARPVDEINVVPDPEEVGRTRWMTPDEYCQSRPSFTDSRRFFSEQFALCREKVWQRYRHRTSGASS